jgi:hypothetical protein
VTDETNLLLEMIKALVKQGVTTKYDGVITWTHCKYCDKSGWWSSQEQSGCPMSHDQDCFIALANKWIVQYTESEDLL